MVLALANAWNIGFLLQKRAVSEPQKVQMVKLENDVSGLDVRRSKGSLYGDR